MTVIKVTVSKCLPCFVCCLITDLDLASGLDTLSLQKSHIGPVDAKKGDSNRPQSPLPHTLKPTVDECIFDQSSILGITPIKCAVFIPSTIYDYSTIFLWIILHSIKPVHLNGSFDSTCTRPETSHLNQSFTILINTSTVIIVDLNNLRFKWHDNSRHQTVK